MTLDVTTVERLIAMADGREPRDEALLNAVAVEAADTRRIASTIEPVVVQRLSHAALIAQLDEHTSA